jgi:hypothetical protein
MFRSAQSSQGSSALAWTRRSSFRRRYPGRTPLPAFQRSPLRRYGCHASTPSRATSKRLPGLRSGGATLRTRSALAVPPGFDGLLRIGNSRVCCTPQSAMGFATFPVPLRSTHEWLCGSGPFPVTPHPSELFPRLQPYRVTAAVALSPLRPRFGSPFPCVAARPRFASARSPTSGPCSTDESVAALRRCHRCAARCSLGLGFPSRVSADDPAVLRGEPRADSGPTSREESTARRPRGGLPQQHRIAQSVETGCVPRHPGSLRRPRAPKVAGKLLCPSVSVEVVFLCRSWEPRFQPESVPLLPSAGAGSLGQAEHSVAHSNRLSRPDHTGVRAGATSAARRPVNWGNPSCRDTRDSSVAVGSTPFGGTSGAVGQRSAIARANVRRSSRLGSAGPGVPKQLRSRCLGSALTSERVPLTGSVGQAPERLLSRPKPAA